jgi:integral membrane sensor domain MASE1
MSMFDAPASGSGASVKPADVEGHLLVVEPLEYVANMTTAFGESDAVRINLHDVSAQESYESVLWFSSALVGSLKGSIGKRILAVMGKGQAKPGQSAPWVLVDATSNEQAVAAATAYINGQTAATMAPPAAPAAPQQSELDAALANLSAAGLTK